MDVAGIVQAQVAGSEPTYEGLKEAIMREGVPRGRTFGAYL